MLVTKVSAVIICTSPNVMIMMNGVLFSIPRKSRTKSERNCIRAAFAPK
jgi:hypothetical protein